LTYSTFSCCYFSFLPVLFSLVPASYFLPGHWHSDRDGVVRHLWDLLLVAVLPSSHTPPNTKPRSSACIYTYSTYLKVDGRESQLVPKPQAVVATWYAPFTDRQPDGTPVTLPPSLYSTSTKGTLQQGRTLTRFHTLHTLDTFQSLTQPSFPALRSLTLHPNCPWRLFPRKSCSGASV